MKLTRVKIILLAAGAATHALLAGAQTNGVPGATDYAAFRRFVTERNIFDPNRQPHYTSPNTYTHITHTHVPASAPAFSLVGTMSYQKGRFAFFSGNADELKQVLPVAQKIAGYTVTEITADHVTLATTNEAGQLELKIGDVVRQAGGKWTLSDSRELPAGTPSGSAPADDTTAPVPSPALGQNDVLKRLMELRAKESQ